MQRASENRFSSAAASNEAESLKNFMRNPRTWIDEEISASSRFVIEKNNLEFLSCRHVLNLSFLPFHFAVASGKVFFGSYEISSSYLWTSEHKHQTTVAILKRLILWSRSIMMQFQLSWRNFSLSEASVLFIVGDFTSRHMKDFSFQVHLCIRVEQSVGESLLITALLSHMIHWHKSV